MLEDQSIPTPELEVHLVGQSPAFLEMLRLVKRVASTDATVVIEGETGTGKELVARAIHYLGARREMPFVAVNCGAFPDSLVENELFGHTRGAFTDARGDHPGLLQLAHRGTLLLDEVDSLPLKAQVVLLRFLQDRRFRPLGGTIEQQVDVRVIAASNSSLETAVRTGAFRSDLYYRLRLAALLLPPLRARTGDAELLAAHFIRECARRYAAPEKVLASRTVDWFRRYDWPGNIRELEYLIHREFLLGEGREIAVGPPDTLGALSRGPDPAASPEPLPSYRAARRRALELFDRGYLETVLARASGNVTQAAHLAGKERRALGKLIKRYGITPTSCDSGG
jgi:transcriptional regulator with GAF, ATPase, and Fis domain